MSLLAWLVGLGSLLMFGVIAVHLLVALVLIIPTWRICTRAGFSGALSLFHLVPLIGSFIVMAVLAFSDEIDGWLAGTPKRLDQAPNGSSVLHSDRTLRMHSVFLQAKLGCERAQSLAVRLLATRALIEQLTTSLQRSQARRTELVSKIAVTKEQLSLSPRDVPRASA